MPKVTPRKFQIRMSPELDAIVESVGKATAKSKNELINDWLWSRARPGDDAERLVEAIWPVLAVLSPADRAEFVDKAISALEVLAAGLPKGRRTARKARG